LNRNQFTKDAITVVVTRRVKRGREKEAERWISGIIQAAMKFEGHLGANIIPSTNPQKPEYVVIFRFNNDENLKKWEESTIRSEWIDQAKTFTVGKTKIQKTTGNSNRCQKGIKLFCDIGFVNFTDQSITIFP